MHPYRQPCFPPPPPRPLPWRAICFVASVPFGFALLVSDGPHSIVWILPGLLLGFIGDVASEDGILRRAIRQARGDFDD